MYKYKLYNNNKVQELKSRFSRSELFKYVLLELAKEKGIPIDIILYIFKLYKRSIIIDEGNTRMYLHNIIAYHTLKYNYWPSLNMYTDIFKVRFPSNRGLEWSIKNHMQQSTILESDGRNLYPRNKLLAEINIINAKYKEYSFLNKYAYKTKKSIEEMYIKPLSLKEKVRFINDCDIIEIYQDYLEWISLTWGLLGENGAFKPYGLLVDESFTDSIYIGNDLYLLDNTT